VRIYGIRERVQYEIDDLIEFFLKEADAEARAAELNEARSEYWDDYTVEEVIVR